MSRTLHAFESCEYKEDAPDWGHIKYINDQGFDIAYGNWSYIHNLMSFCNYVNKTNLVIPTYDIFDDAKKAKDMTLKLVKPSIFEKCLVTTLASLKKLNTNTNKLLDNNTYLFEDEATSYETFEEQKNEMISYAEKLLEWAKLGLYFTSDKD